MTPPRGRLSRLREQGGGRNLVDPAALIRIASLELRARMVVQGFWAGLHRSPAHGFSVEFTEYRQYTPGDDIRQLDWRVYARSDRYFVRRFEDETNLRCYLLVDQSASMSYASNSHSKSEYAATLAGTLGYFLYQQGDAVGMLSFDRGVIDYLPARNRGGHLRQFMLALQKPAQGRGTDLTLPIRRIADLVTRRALVILVSDLLASPDALEPQLTYLRTCGHEVEIFHVLDPAEAEFPFTEAGRFHDVESERHLHVDPGRARETYLAGLERHTAYIRTMCNNLGIGFHPQQTDRPIELALHDFLTHRSGRARGITRQSAPRGAAIGGSS